MSNPLTMKLEQFTRFQPSERLLLDELVQGPVRHYARGQRILREGEKVDDIHLVTKGLAARSKTLKDGSRQLMAFLVPGDLCDLEVFVLEGMDHDIIALADTSCAVIPAKAIEQLLTNSSNVTRALWWSTMTDSAVLREWIVNHGSRDSHARLAHLICELLVRYRIVGIGEGETIPFPITQEELSEATGMTPIHMNRMIQQLRSDGLIELKHKMLTVLDFSRLRDVAAFEPRYLHLVRTERADPAVAERVGDLLPPHSPGLLQKAWEAAAHPFAQSRH